MALTRLPDEIVIRILSFLDIPELFSTSRTSHHLRNLSFDPLLHRLRLQYSSQRVQHLLSQRPPLASLQPPTSTIYLTRTHLAARRLHWSLVCIKLNRSLARRPKLATLVSTNIIPKESCKLDRRSGQIEWGTGVAGALIERKRRLEREQIKEGLRVWLERKAREIRERKKKEGGVGVLVWRFSRRLKIGGGGDGREGGGRDGAGWSEKPRKDKVSGLKRFWEGLGDGKLSTSLTA